MRGRTKLQCMRAEVRRLVGGFPLLDVVVLEVVFSAYVLRGHGDEPATIVKQMRQMRVTPSIQVCQMGIVSCVAACVHLCPLTSRHMGVAWRHAARQPDGTWCHGM
eukprot:1527997-Amphidinium_carterae.1